MNWPKTILCAAVSLWIAGLAHGEAFAATLFVDDFESYSPGDDPTADPRWDINANAVIAANPVATGNASAQALNFTANESGGDLFSRVISLAAGQTYAIGFDYLGTAAQSGGFAGVSATDTSNHFWYYSTEPSVSGSDPILESDNTWHDYTYIFTAPVLGVIDIRLMFEDFGTESGDAYFDNITLTAVPLPAALPLFGFGLAALALASRRRLRGPVALDRA